jgi:hypothetical protein
LEEDGTVASIISFTLRRETSIEYEPYWPGIGFSPHRRPIVHFLISVYSIPDVEVEISVKFCIFKNFEAKRAKNGSTYQKMYFVIVS